jgi:hypothetical protein
MLSPKNACSEAHAVEPPREPPLPVRLDRVTVAAVEELAIEAPNASADPGPAAVEARRGAARDHRVEIVVDPDLERIGTHRAGEPPGDMKVVKRDNAPLARFDPEQRWVVGILAIGKMPAA